MGHISKRKAVAIRKHLLQFVFVPQNQIRGMEEDNRFCRPTPWFTFDLPGNRKNVLGMFWKVELALQL